MLILAWCILIGAALLGVLLVTVGISGQFLYPLCAIAVRLFLGPPTDDDGGGGIISWTHVGVVIGVAVLVEVGEFFAGLLGGRKAGGSRSAAVGAVLGGIAGAIFGGIFIPIPLIGSLIGVLAGTFTGAATLEYVQDRNVDASLKVGGGAFIGRVIGIALKGAVACAFLAVAVTGFILYLWN